MNAVQSTPIQRPSLMKMTWPVFIELSMAMLVGNVDQFMISNYDNNSVSAIGNANTVMNLLILTFNIISLSTTILVSQYIGANQKEKLDKVYSLAVAVNLTLGAVVSAGLVIFAKPIAHLMNINPVLLDRFQTYFTIVGGMIFTQALFSTFSAILKSNAHVKSIMFISIGINLINIVLNALLIYGIGPFPELGIAGVAIATVVGRIVGLVLVILIYMKQIGVKLSIKKIMPFPKDIFKKMLSIGIPSAGESISYNLTLLIIMRMINPFGPDVSNTKFYASMFATFTWMFASAISQASQILVGYYIGAGDRDSAARQVKKTLKLAILISFIIGVIICTISDGMFSLMTSNKDIWELGKKVLAIDIILECGRAVNIVMVRSLQAAGDTKFPIMLGIISTWSIAVLMSYVLGVHFNLGLVGIWIAMAGDECVRGIIFIFRWKQGKWRKINLLK